MRGISIRTKIVLLFVALALLLAASMALLTYALTYQRLVAQYGNLAVNAAELAATDLNGDAIHSYLTRGADASYYVAQAKLRNLKAELGLRFLYVSVPDMEHNDAVYVFDIALPDQEDMTLINKLGDHSGESDVYDLTTSVMRSGETAANKRITKGEFGYLLSAYAPLKDSEDETVAVVGVDIDMVKVILLAVMETLKLLLLMACVISVFIVLSILITNKSVINPIKRLSAHMAAFDKHSDALELAPFVTKNRDEIGVMATSFNDMAANIREYVENLRIVTADKQRIATELSVANTIQSSMLPRIFPFPPHRREFSVYATMAPAKSVGGDFYDFYILHGAEQTGTHLAFVMADVSGKGIPAALFMAITQSLFKTRAMQGENPAQIFANVNDQLCQNNDAGMFVTVYMGLLELATGRLTIANAGHNPPLLRHRSGRYEWLRQKSGFVLAGMEHMRYTNVEFILEPGDRLFLYTDGVTEALNPNNDLYGEARLEETLNQSDAASLDVMALLPYVKRSIDVFADGAEQADDITMLALDWYGASPEPSAPPASDA